MVASGLVRPFAFSSILLVAGALHAADPMDLDTGFGLAGRVATNFGSQDTATAVVLQPDGKIVVVGNTFVGTGFDFSIARYLSSGPLDQSFGGNGRVTTDVGGADQAFAVAVQADGRIVVAGGSDNGPEGAAIALVRYQPNGALDAGFGTGGVVRTSIRDFSYGFALALQSDGRILVAGQTVSFSGNDDSDLVVVRYQTDGSLDGSFGSNGVVVTDFNQRWDIAKDVGVLADGRIVAVGSSWGPNFSPAFGALARYHPDGQLDQSLNFGSLLCTLASACGKGSLNLGGGAYDWIAALALRRPDGTEDGKMVVSGAFGVARLNANGSFDAFFSGDGINESGPSAGDGVAIRDDGRVVRVGRDAGDFSIELYDVDGDLAVDCSANPVRTVDFNAGWDNAYAVTIQADGKIVVAGTGEVFDTGDYALARLLGGECDPLLALKKARYFVAYHKFVNPQDKVGPTWPGIVPAGLARSTQVVVPVLASEAALPYAFKNYVFGETAPGDGVTGAVTSRRSVPEGRRFLLSTAIGDFAVLTGRPDHVMLPAHVRARQVRLEVPQTDASGGYRCDLARSPTTGRLALADPLNPGLRIGIEQVTHLCEAWDGTERTAMEPDLLLCFAAGNNGGRTQRLYVRDVLGAQIARVAAAETVCVQAIDSARGAGIR